MMRKKYNGLFILFLVSVPILSIGCSSSNNPSSPGSGVTPDSNGPIIEAFLGNIDIPSVNVGVFTSVYIIDNAGNPVTTASVTLVTPGGSYPATFNGVNMSNPPPNSGVTNISGGWYTGSAAYVGGQNCSFKVGIGANTYTGSFTTLNSSAAAVTGSTGVTWTWTGGGNENFVYVNGNDNLQYGPSPAISSPYVIPAANFVSDPAGHGNDTVELWLFQTKIPGFSGCKSSSAVGSMVVKGLSY